MKTRLHSFDGTEAIETNLSCPDRFSSLRAELSAPGVSIARGAGLSYCAAGIGPRTVCFGRFDRLLSFNETAGLLEVEAGATLGKIFEFCAPRGWQLPVMPGHPSITVGGCAAANVHGKNQHREGNFAAVVESLRLHHPDRGERLCSRERDPELFFLTLGGFGLTGFIISLQLRLKRLPATAFLLTRTPVDSLEDAVAAMKERLDADSIYSWHEFGSRRFGRGFVFSAQAVPGRLPTTLKFAPLDARARRGPCVYNRVTAPLALAAYAWEERLSPQLRTITAAQAIFPVVGKEFYFALFGRGGFREYQLLLPWTVWPQACRRLSTLLVGHCVPMTLASLKIFAGRGRGLNFEGEGVCLTLDAPDGPRTLKLWSALDELMIEMGGIVNVAKDSRLSAETARRLFPDYGTFKSALEAWDPARRCDSALRKRLEL